ncbi:hypothetical protein BHM03_00062820 [Ensete ventricosum]|uniref:Uncharacterized protein n=1 Tax=Ensete ventricosum TaxID=4639 RepID=A0A445MMX2_ENSVE|nr:hypothetical protein BHM03_00062820 [Ensete ventricosum]
MRRGARNMWLRRETSAATEREGRPRWRSKHQKKQRAEGAKNGISVVRGGRQRRRRRRWWGEAVEEKRGRTGSGGWGAGVGEGVGPAEDYGSTLTNYLLVSLAAVPANSVGNMIPALT